MIDHMVGKEKHSFQFQKWKLPAKLIYSLSQFLELEGVIFLADRAR